MTITKEEIIVSIKSEGFRDINKQFAFLNKRITNATRANQKQMRDTNKLMGGSAQKLINNATQINKLGKRHEGFFKVLGMSQENWSKFNKEGGQFNKLSSRAANSIRKFTHGLRGFRMEMLGVMFFGMGLSKFFIGLIKPALQMTGFFETWTTALQILFLPIALQLLQWGIKFLKWVTKLSPETRLLIGKFVLLAAALSLGLFLFGMFMLGIGAMIMAFSGLLNIISKFIPDVTLLGVNMSSFIEAGLGITLITKSFGFLKNVVNKVLDKLLEIDFVGEAFDKLGIKIDDTKTPLENLKTFFKKTISEIKEGFDFDSAVDGVTTNLTDLQTTFEDSVNIIVPEIEKIATAMEKIVGWIDKIIEKWDKFQKFRKGVIDSPIGFLSRINIDDDSSSSVNSNKSNINITMNNDVKVADKSEMITVFESLATSMSREVRRNTT